MFVKQKEIWYISRVHSNYSLFWAQSFGSIRAPRIIIRTVHTKWIKTNLVISISLGWNSDFDYESWALLKNLTLQNFKNSIFQSKMVSAFYALFVWTLNLNLLQNSLYFHACTYLQGCWKNERKFGMINVFDWFCSLVISTLLYWILKKLPYPRH